MLPDVQQSLRILRQRLLFSPLCQFVWLQDGWDRFLPNRVQFLPLTNQNYEIALLKNPTLTGATWAATVPTDSNVEFDVAATAISNVGSVVQTDYITSTGSGGTANTSVATGYNWDLQLGASIAGVSDIYTLAVRTVSGATNGSGVGSLSFYDLTQ